MLENVCKTLSTGRDGVFCSYCEPSLSDLIRTFPVWGTHCRNQQCYLQFNIYGHKWWLKVVVSERLGIVHVTVVLSVHLQLKRLAQKTAAVAIKMNNSLSNKIMWHAENTFLNKYTQNKPEESSQVAFSSFIQLQRWNLLAQALRNHPWNPYMAKS